MKVDLNGNKNFNKENQQIITKDRLSQAIYFGTCFQEPKGRGDKKVCDQLKKNHKTLRNIRTGMNSLT